MDPRLFNAEAFRIEHRHRDGTWTPMEPAHHDSADHDAERGWLRGRVFRCPSCEQEVQVTIEPSETESRS